MTNNMERFSFLVLSIAGVVLLFIGGLVLTAEKYNMISSLCIGFGSAMTAIGIGNLIRSFMVSKMEDENTKRFMAIEMNDERNIRIKEKAGYMVSRIMNYMICVLVLALGFMNVDRMIIIMVALLLLTEVILVIIFFNYYSKRM